MAFRRLKRKVPDVFDGKKWTYFEEVIYVEVMAEAKNYAMVRRKGCAPFVVRSKYLID